VSARLCNDDISKFDGVRLLHRALLGGYNDTEITLSSCVVVAQSPGEKRR